MKTVYIAKDVDLLREHGLDLRGLKQIDASKSFNYEAPAKIGDASFRGGCSLGAFTYVVGGLIRNTTVGRYCSIARDVNIGMGAHPLDWLSTHPFQFNANFSYEVGRAFSGGNMLKDHSLQSSVRPKPKKNGVAIGNDVWIAKGVMILPGVTVSDGAVLAAGSVVTKDVAPYSIVGGNPAKHIRYRFSEDIIAALLDVKWWRFAPWDLQGVSFESPEKAISEINERVENDRISEFFPTNVQVEL